MSTLSASEATRSHRPIEVILNSPGRNADRNAFTRLVSPARGNNFLDTFCKVTLATASHEKCVYAGACKRNSRGHSLSLCCSVEPLCVMFIAGANFIRLCSGED